MEPTDSQIEQVGNLVRGGAALESAAKYVGIELQELHEMMLAGRDFRTEGGGNVGQFYRVVISASAQADLADQAIVAEAAKNNWQAASHRIADRRNREIESDLARLRALTTDAA